MNFEQKLQNYATLLVHHGLNVQPGQTVNITGELFFRPLITKVVAACYDRGAKYVNVDFIDPEHMKLRIEKSKDPKYLEHVPRYIPTKFDDFVVDPEGSCVLRFTGSEEPDMLAHLDPKKINSQQSSYKKALTNYYTEGVGKPKIQWLVAAHATPKWAKKVYPEVKDEKMAYDMLWDDIFKICRVDKSNFLELWKEHNDKLHARGKKLTDLKIHELHFTGPGTDLKVFLSPKAIFKAGANKTEKGFQFEANIPTEESFTTPDARYTEGKVRVTRPVLINGKQIEGLTLEFKNGEITHFQAKSGQEHFKAYIETDPGAKKLGEVALVGIDSPIYQTGRVFQEILFDENAACHIAVGFAYRFCLEGCNTLTAEELSALGYNQSQVHTDMMISSEEVDVTATTYSGENVALIKKGKWVL